MTNKTSTIIIAGFALVILLVTSLLIISLQQIQTSNHELQNNIKIKSKHAAWANELQRISTKRSEIMLNILQTKDAFEREDYVQKFYLLGQSFIQTRNNFYNTPDNHNDEEKLTANKSLIKKIVKAQYEIISLLNKDEYNKAHRIFITKALPLQQENANKLNNLSNFHIEEIKKISKKLALQQRKTFYLILLSGIIVILFCILIAWFIIKVFSKNLRDITLGKENLSASLLEKKNLLSALNQHAIVSITDTTGKITFVNEKFCEISQYLQDELIGQQHNIINSGLHNKTYFRNMWATITSGLTWHGEIRNRKKDGSYYWVATTIVPFLGETGINYQYIALRTDITKQKNTEYILEKSLIKLAIESEKAAQSNILKESIVSTMTHELRTPLNSILGFSQLLLLDEDSLSEPQKQNLNNIYLSGKELLLKVDNIMLYSQLKSNRVKLHHNEFDLSTLIKSIIEAIKLNIPDLAITPTMINDDSLFMIADTDLLRKAISYVLENAIKFTEEGSISIEYSIIYKDDELPSTGKTAEQNFILIKIRDTGVGIVEDKIDIVFDEFRQSDEKDNRSFEGIGIGLALSKQIISLHQGEIWLTSKSNEGTIVYITIPQVLL